LFFQTIELSVIHENHPWVVLHVAYLALLLGRSFF